MSEDAETGEGAQTPAPAEAPPGPEQTVIPAALSPAEAGAVRAALLDALAAARATGAPFAVEVADEGAWPCAVQLLAAAEKSALAAGVPFAPGPGAAALRIPLGASETH